MKKRSTAGKTAAEESIINKDLFEALAALEKERGISQSYMLERVEAALLSAFRKEYHGNENAVVRIDPLGQDVRIFKTYTVVEEVLDEDSELLLDDARKLSPTCQLGDTVQREIKTKSFGRIAAQAAKQVIVQGIREAERGMIIREYENKKEEIVTAVVVRVDPTTGNATLEIGKNEMVLFRHDQIPGESLQVGDRVKVFVTEIKKETRGPSVVLSRVHPGLVRRLFEQEVPEIQDGTVEIMAIAREPGSRTKIAVRSNDDKVDPIGACIGQRGARKNLITEELCGEKIDIIPYSETVEDFIRAALAPATVEDVLPLDDTGRAYRAIVAEDQLSLAIGKEGQNARLAARLTGFKIDIKSRRALEAAVPEPDASPDAAENGATDAAPEAAPEA